MELLLTDSLKPTHLVWQIGVDDVRGAIAAANDAWKAGKGHTVLFSRLSDLQVSETDYLSL